MNWGYKILLLYSGFILMTLVMVFLAYRQDTPLVSKDYYEKELRYQEDIDEMKNARELPDPIRIEYLPSEEILEIRYPQSNTGQIKGNIQLMRPSDPLQDTGFEVKAGDNRQQRISTASMARGLWKLRIGWENSGKKYLEEKDLILQ